MDPSKISYETFGKAYDEAVEQSEGVMGKIKFPDTLTGILIRLLEEEGVEEVRADTERVREKIKGTISAVEEERGIEFVMESRVAFQLAFFNRLASRMTLSDMPAGVRTSASGQFKLDLPESVRNGGTGTSESGE